MKRPRKVFIAFHLAPIPGLASIGTVFLSKRDIPDYYNMKHVLEYEMVKLS